MPPRSTAVPGMFQKAETRASHAGGSRTRATVGVNCFAKANRNRSQPGRERRWSAALPMFDLKRNASKPKSVWERITRFCCGATGSYYIIKREALPKHSAQRNISHFANAKYITRRRRISHFSRSEIHHCAGRSTALIQFLPAPPALPFSRGSGNRGSALRRAGGRPWGRRPGGGPALP